jgi:hypothetical protein
MPGDTDQPIDEALTVPDLPEATRQPDAGLQAEPDGDLAFVPGADVPLPPPPDDVPRCSWCSASLVDPAAATCPSCGAQLAAPEPVDVPGLTAVDPALLALANRPKPERRSLASWLGGEAVDEYPLPSEAELAALAPPDPAVRREMRRLELAAMGIVVEDVAAGGGPGEAAPTGEAANRPIGEAVSPGDDEAPPHAETGTAADPA